MFRFWTKWYNIVIELRVKKMNFIIIMSHRLSHPGLTFQSILIYLFLKVNSDELFKVMEQKWLLFMLSNKILRSIYCFTKNAVYFLSNYSMNITKEHSVFKLGRFN